MKNNETMSYFLRLFLKLTNYNMCIKQCFCGVFVRKVYIFPIYFSVPVKSVRALGGNTV